MTDTDGWLPSQRENPNGDTRRVGVEIEFAGVNGAKIAEIVAACFGGKVKALSAVELNITNTCLGDFIVELDADAIKSFNDTNLVNAFEPDSMGQKAVELINVAAEQFVPWEVVSPPIAVTQLSEFNQLIAHLRAAGALGTRHALHYAFGVHLNPELPSLEPQCILSYLRAFLCLYDWIVAQDKIDIARKLTPYIDHFPKRYIRTVINSEYQPSQQQLIDDYLHYNPTRNRSLDLLPLFAHLDEQRVRAAVDDDRIKPRPTFHYRLPNCDIDNPYWDISTSWSLWLAVESLAQNSDQLQYFCDNYEMFLSSLTAPLSNQWLQFVTQQLNSQQ